jgi:hypothetical protein
MAGVRFCIGPQVVVVRAEVQIGQMQDPLRH